MMQINNIDDKDPVALNRKCIVLNSPTEFKR